MDKESLLLNKTLAANKGARLWKEAKKIIPGGNQLLSKRAEMFLPELWPAYYKKAKGCRIWDLEDRMYYDLSQMGVCACILGYADDDVDRKVKEAVDQGTMTTLNCYEEVELAQKLISLHPWAQMARFARTGGEACAVAVRIARAATGKDKVAFCGYHGWHDWYLSANLSEKDNLDGQLLPGLTPAGVPRGLKNTVFPFHYNSLTELENIIKKNGAEIGVIIMEVFRSKEPQAEFLQGARKIAEKTGAVLIFDEITSGFRANAGGIHLKYGVSPDIAVFGKALGNGYPISAIIGKKKFMNAAQESFISSTFWTERIGFVAALATIEKLERASVCETLDMFGGKIRNGLLTKAKAAGIRLKIDGVNPMLHLSYDDSRSAAMQTFITQEMLKRGFLASSIVCVSWALTEEIISEFLGHMGDIYEQLAGILKEERDLNSHLEGPVKHSGFKRLTG